MKTQTPQKAAAAEPLSPFSAMDSLCWRCQASTEYKHFCPKCQALLPPPEGSTHFELLGLKPSPIVDETELRNVFLELSKQLHPDKFSAADGPQSLYATRWSTLINRAYQTLREPAQCTNYLLEINHIPSPKNVPTDLAETYFELQDIEAHSPGNLGTFLKFLETEITKSELERSKLNVEWTAHGASPSLLKSLSETLNREKYLLSMKRDLNKRLGLPE